MKKKNKTGEEFETEQFVQKLDKTAFTVESFLEKNTKIITIVLGILILSVVGYFGYMKLFLEPKSEAALKEMAQAEKLFDQDSINLALNGSPGSFQGLQQIVNEYGSTEAGNLAKFKAGVAYYKLGDYASAIKLLESFKSNDDVMEAQKLGMVGNALTQSGKMEDGLKYFVKAAELTDIQTIQVVYYTKAGKLAMELGKNKEALDYFRAIVEKYPEINDSEAEKFVERLKYSIE